jgi:hypothetical protein
MRQPPHPPSLEVRMQAAWPAPLAPAVKTSGVLPALMRHDALVPRTRAYYAHLQALPRRVRRALQRHWGVPLATLALWLALGALPGLAAIIPVGGPCTLVDAMTAANTDTATGGCAAGSGADTIVLPPGSTQSLTKVHNDTYGPTGLPVISSVITIAGQGSTIARASGAPEFRLLTVNGTGDLTLQETTASGGASTGYPGRGSGVANYGGTLTITNSTISGNTSRDAGGGVNNEYGGTLTITNSTIAGNAGGGVGNSGTLTITNSTISGNTASYGGGGVANYGGTLTITNSTISGNTADGRGGGVANFRSTLTITDSTIAGNTSRDAGGGVNNEYGGTLTITNSTIAGNAGNGVFNSYFSTVTITNSTISGNTASVGGGVGNRASTLTITNSTIAGNTASYGGGGVANLASFYGDFGVIPGTLTITNSTISGNTADTRDGGVANVGSDLTLIRTLVSGNTAPVTPEVFNDGAVVADSHNLFGVDGDAGVVGFSPDPTDVVPPAGVRLPAILEPTLALHGGRTQTLALVPGSPAIDAGGPVCLDAEGNSLRTDQRGRPRPVDGNGDGLVACDIGAFEFFPVVSDLVTLDPDLDTGFDPTPVPGGPAGTYTSTTPLHTPFFEVTALSGGNLLLNADAGPGGVGATLTPAVGDGVLAPGETVAADFVLGLQERTPFTFVVELFGEPGP